MMVVGGWGGLVGREGEWTRQGAPPNGANYAHPHPGWIRMGGRHRKFGKGGGTTMGRPSLLLSNEGRPTRAPDLAGVLTPPPDYTT